MGCGSSSPSSTVVSCDPPVPNKTNGPSTKDSVPSSTTSDKVLKTDSEEIVNSKAVSKEVTVKQLNENAAPSTSGEEKSLPSESSASKDDEDAKQKQKELAQKNQEMIAAMKKKVPL